jgi:hypothetical protein
MNFNPLVLAIGMNLLEREITDEEKIRKIEQAVAFVLRPYVSGGIKEEEMIFNFPLDPSVTSPEIPVAFRITMLPSVRIPYGEIKFGKVSEEINRLVHEILSERPNILVLVEALTWKQASLVVDS